MRQTCEYCCYLCTGNGIWCDLKEKEMAESTSKSTNHCMEVLRNLLDEECNKGTVNTVIWNLRSRLNTRLIKIKE